MAGHSKWANIKHRKARMDEKKAQVFTKIGRELIMAAKQGGSDPEANQKLKAVIQKAREANMPMENINRVIQKASGELSGVNYEEVIYEGYGPGGVAILLNIATDNRNRTAGEIRYLFSRNGGILGESGCVSWLFEQKGLIILYAKGDPDNIMLQAIEAGAEDVVADGNRIEVVTSSEDFFTVNEVLSKATQIGQAEITMVPKTSVLIDDAEQAKQLVRLLELFEDHDDVQAVYANFVLSEEVSDALGLSE